MSNKEAVGRSKEAFRYEFNADGWPWNWLICLARRCMVFYAILHAESTRDRIQMRD